MEIAEKVVTDAAQELKKEVEDYDGGSLPGKYSKWYDQIWAMEEGILLFMVLLALSG